MKQETEKEIQDALKAQNPELEQITPASESPLNTPVIEKDIADVLEDKSEKDSTADSESTNFRAQAVSEAQNEKNTTEQAPEQEINFSIDNDEFSDTTFSEAAAPFTDQISQTVVGVTDNLIGIGGSYFVKVDKKGHFYEHDEIIQMVDTQNEINIERIKLSENDKMLLMPLLSIVLAKRAQNVTPEQQLLGVIISIIISKIQIVKDIRKDNQALEARIIQIIEEKSRKAASEAPTEKVSEDQTQKEIITTDDTSNDGTSILEVAD